MGIGLLSRLEGVATPYFFQRYGGDTIWAALVYIGFATLFTQTKPLYIALFSLFFAYGIEFLQLYQAPWITAIRSTKIGGLILGFGFLPSDLICYTVGVVAAYSLEKLYLSKQNNK